MLKYVYVYVCMWRPLVTVGRLPQLFFILVLEAESLTEPGDH